MILFDKYINHLKVTAKQSSWARAGFAAYHFSRLNCEPQEGESITRKVDLYVTLRRGENAKDSTINAELRILRAALNFDGGSQGSKVKLLREQRLLPTILEPGQEDRLFSACAILRAQLAMRFALYAGLRHEEIKHLRWMDVSFNERMIYVAPHDGWSPKNHTERAVPLSEKLVNSLSWGEDGIRAALIIGSGDLYVPVAQAFRACGVSSRADRAGLHMLRRTFASRMLANGADINTVRELMGHADLATTQRYLVSSLPQKRAAVAGL
jgi:integrase